MKAFFSFSEQEINMLARKTSTLIPGISKVLSIQFSNAKNGYRSVYIEKNTEGVNENDIYIDDSLRDKIVEILKSNDSFAWLSKKELPFEVSKDQIVQLDVFSELDKNILLIPLLSQDKKQEYFFFFYFNDNLSNFFLSHSEKSLTQENKIIIAKMLYHSISNMLDVLLTDRKIMMEYNQGVEQIKKDLEEARKNLRSLEEKHENINYNYAMEIIEELSKNFPGKKIVLSNQAAIKIKSFTGDFAQIRLGLRNAIHLVAGLNIGYDRDMLVIEDSLFSLSGALPEKTSKAVSIGGITRHRIKTIELLDRLEEAAEIVISKKIKINAANICDAYYKKISPPGISDALKNHQKTIKSVAMEFPTKWKIIRNEFKPMLNILDITSKKELKKDIG